MIPLAGRSNGSTEVVMEYQVKNMRRVRGVVAASAAWGVMTAAVLACTSNTITIDDGDLESGSSSTSDGTTGVISTTTAVDDDTGSGETGSIEPDLPSPPDPTACQESGTCDFLDLLFVIDNSGTMGDEQLALASNVGAIVDEISTLEDEDGRLVYPNVNIMVTTTDMGHPLCTAFQKPDYTPAAGAPIYTGCNARINRFTGLDPTSPEVIEEACTANCPFDVAPSDHFVHFSSFGSNVPDDDVEAALQCLLPQGIDGCGFESPLESMIQALDPSACWNDPSQPACDEDPEWVDVEQGFLRQGGLLGVVLFTDELDCSVAAPGGYSFFTEIANDIYWNVNPQTGLPQASSAICFNAGVTCVDADGDGLYEGGCASYDSGALHPIARYTGFLDFFVGQGKEVVMMGVVGVPEVTAHSPDPPFEPTAGGVFDLLYRDWIDFPYPNGDILPDEWGAGIDAARKRWEYGELGPGCTGTDAMGNFTGQALPPVRIREVCESLDTVDESGELSVRCCLESICDSDYSAAIRCLSGRLTAEAPMGD